MESNEIHQEGKCNLIIHHLLVDMKHAVRGPTHERVGQVSMTGSLVKGGIAGAISTLPTWFDRTGIVPTPERNNYSILLKETKKYFVIEASDKGFCLGLPGVKNK